MKLLYFSFLIQLFIYSSYGQNTTPIDSATIDKVDSLVFLSEDLLNGSHLDSAKQVANYALQFSQEIGYNVGMGQAFIAIANVYGMMGNNAKDIEYAKKAADLFEEGGNYHKLAIVLYNIATTLYNDLQYEAALEYVEKARTYFIEIDDRRMLINANANMGAMYIRMERPLEQILSTLSEAEEMAKEDSNMFLLSRVLNNKGIAYVRAKKNVDQAIKMFSESLTTQRKGNIDDDFLKGYSYSGLSDAYHMKKNYNISLLYNDTSLIAFKRLQYPAGLKDVYETRKNIYAGKGDYKKAFETLDELSVLKDTLYSDQRSQQLSQIRMEYETEKKEAEIASLSQQSSIQALEIKQKNQAIIIGLVVILFVLVVIYFLYSQRESKKQQSQTELEQRFLRSQLNPHFISNALVAVQSFMLKNDSESAALYLTKFSKLMREILENSRKEFIPVEEEIGMLRNYLDIHKLRLGSFDYSIELDENVNPEVDTIPPMFVQPFIENAVEHGIGDLKQGGRIDLKFQKEEDYISIRVIDNGRGLSPNKVASHKSLSTTIIQQRMDLFNKSLKSKIQVVVDNLKNEKGEVSGTKVELKVPFS